MALTYALLLLTFYSPAAAFVADGTPATHNSLADILAVIADERTLRRNLENDVTQLKTQLQQQLGQLNKEVVSLQNGKKLR